MCLSHNGSERGRASEMRSPPSFSPNRKGDGGHSYSDAEGRQSPRLSFAAPFSSLALAAFSRFLVLEERRIPPTAANDSRARRNGNRRPRHFRGWRRIHYSVVAWQEEEGLSRLAALWLAVMRALTGAVIWRTASLSQAPWRPRAAAAGSRGTNGFPSGARKKGPEISWPSVSAGLFLFLGGREAKEG